MPSIAAAMSSASRGVAANRMPPNPARPVSQTWIFRTTGFPIFSAMARASAEEKATSPAGTRMPLCLRSFLLWYSNSFASGAFLGLGWIDTQVY